MSEPGILFTALLYALPPLLAFLLTLSSVREIYFYHRGRSRAVTFGTALLYFAATYTVTLLACSLLYDFVSPEIRQEAGPDILMAAIPAGFIVALLLFPNFADRLEAARAAAPRPRKYSATIACWLLAACLVLPH